jgi:pyruvate/2-oxoglutarate dehydrogenase complex dihydrolipoamide acyltransferase (E2) component
MREALARVLAPMLSVNEPEAQLVDVFVTTGRRVSVGDPLCTLETTKATFEVQAEVEGYIHDVLVSKGQQVTAGALLFEISSEPPAEPAASSPPAADAEPRPEGLLITEKGSA